MFRVFSFVLIILYLSFHLLYENKVSHQILNCCRQWTKSPTKPRCKWTKYGIENMCLGPFPLFCLFLYTSVCSMKIWFNTKYWTVTDSAQKNPPQRSHGANEPKTFKDQKNLPQFIHVNLPFCYISSLPQQFNKSTKYIHLRTHSKHSLMVQLSI